MSNFCDPIDQAEAELAALNQRGGHLAVVKIPSMSFVLAGLTQGKAKDGCS